MGEASKAAALRSRAPAETSLRACAYSRPAKILHPVALTMRSGIGIDNRDFAVDIMVDRPADPLRFILDQPLYAQPGAKFYYRDADPQLVSYALQRIHGRTLESLGVEHLLGPLGITDWLWDAFPTDGTSTGAFALHLRPRDFAKLGQLMLDDGKWAGAQLVSKEWLDLATTTKVANVPDGPRDNPFGYGFYFWVPTAPAGSYAMAGHGGQFVFVVPARRLVLVQVALPDTSGDDLHGGRLEDFIELTLPLWQ